MAHLFRPASARPFDRVRVWTDSGGTTRAVITTASGQAIRNDDPATGQPVDGLLVADAQGGLPQFRCATTPVYVGAPGSPTRLDPLPVEEDTPAPTPSAGTSTSGTLAARPAAAAFGVGWYFATDDNGGTLYHSDGTAWSQMAPGITAPAGTELAYAEITSTASGLTSTTAVDVAGLSITFTLAAPKAVVLSMGVPLATVTATSGAGTLLLFLEDSSNKEVTRAIFVATQTTSVAFGSLFGRRRLSLAAGTYTYKVRYAVSGTGASGTIFATTTGGDGGGSHIPSLQAVTV